MSDDRLEKFIQEYVANGGNGTAAAKAAGYSNKGTSARVQAHRLLQRDDVREAILKQAMRHTMIDGIVGRKILRDLAERVKDENLLFKIAKELKDSAGLKVADKHEFIVKEERTEEQLAQDIAKELNIPVEEVWKRFAGGEPGSLH